uniref:Uncharacterized protein n=1 Tax=Lactuca sativa TaxID=4236 RepID=A0A9R1UGE1_LACSA|nr:hypothetical protein LSAT_V11C900494860 [Lactuca sativa]
MIDILEILIVLLMMVSLQFIYLMKGNSFFWEVANLDKLDIFDLAQKANVKWSVEGDENSRFFHGMLKKKHHIFICGVSVNGDWVTELLAVEKKFLISILPSSNLSIIFRWRLKVIGFLLSDLRMLRV